MTNAKPPLEEEILRDDLDEQLEEGLEDSFPASDPPSVTRRHRTLPHDASDVESENE